MVPSELHPPAAPAPSPAEDPPPHPYGRREHSLTRSAVRLGLLALVIAGASLPLWPGVGDHLTPRALFSALRRHRSELVSFVHAHPVQSVAAYLAAYAAVVGLSLPGALVMTLTGGFLFGLWLGTGAAVVGASTGAVIMFLVARTALGGWLRRQVAKGGVLARIEAGARRDAFSYILTLRLMPAVPFFAVNFAAGFMGMRLLPYIAATVLGCIPSTLIYAWVGADLGHLFDLGQKPHLSTLIQPAIVLPLFGLAALAAAPALIHLWQARGARRRQAAEQAPPRVAADGGMM